MARASCQLWKASRGRWRAAAEGQHHLMDDGAEEARYAYGCSVVS